MTDTELYMKERFTVIDQMLLEIQGSQLKSASRASRHLPKNPNAEIYRKLYSDLDRITNADEFYPKRRVFEQELFEKIFNYAPSLIWSRDVVGHALRENRAHAHIELDNYSRGKIVRTPLLLVAHLYGQESDGPFGYNDKESAELFIIDEH